MELTLRQESQIKKLLQKQGVILAYIFGSFAKDKAGPLSDFDIAVLFSEKVPPQEYFDKELEIAGEIRRILEINRVDVVNLATTNNPLLKHNVVFKGRPILIKDSKARFVLEKKIMQEYEDTEHLRMVQYYYLKKHIKEGAFGRAPIKSKYLERYVANR